MKILKFKQKHEDLIENRIDTIEEALYNGDISYIEPIMEMLIRYAEALDGECLYTNQFQSRLEEAAMWFERIPGSDGVAAEEVEEGD